jgi:DNA-binding NarL/FixJ family response regulator
MEKMNSFSTLVLVHDAGLRQTYLELLAELNVHALEASHSQMAFELLEKQPVNLLIVELRLPRMSGMDFIKNLRQQYSDIQVILTASDFYPAELDDGVALGVSGFVEKVDMRNFLKLVSAARVDWENRVASHPAESP